MITSAEEARELTRAYRPPDYTKPDLVPKYLAVALDQAERAAARGKDDAYVTCSVWSVEPQPSDDACRLAIRKRGFWARACLGGADQIAWGVYPWWRRFLMRFDGWKAPL